MVGPPERIIDDDRGTATVSTCDDRGAGKPSYDTQLLLRASR